MGVLLLMKPGARPRTARPIRPTPDRMSRGGARRMPAESGGTRAFQRGSARRLSQVGVRASAFEHARPCSARWSRASRRARGRSTRAGGPCGARRARHRDPTRGRPPPRRAAPPAAMSHGAEPLLPEPVHPSRRDVADVERRRAEAAHRARRRDERAEQPEHLLRLLVDGVRKPGDEQRVDQPIGRRHGEPLAVQPRAAARARP